MKIKTENVEESLEPVDVDKAGSAASGEGTHGLSKMFAVLGYCLPNTLRKQIFSTGEACSRNTVVRLSVYVCVVNCF